MAVRPNKLDRSHMETLNNGDVTRSKVNSTVLKSLIKAHRQWRRRSRNWQTTESHGRRHKNWQSSQRLCEFRRCKF